MITTLQPNDVVRTESGMCNCVVLDTFAGGTMAVIAEITPAGTIDKSTRCAYSVATMNLVERAPQTAEVVA
jgi:hypothetical protein